MAWISIHEEVFGPKLRHFSKMTGCDRPQALGILVTLWMWGIKNADMDGLIKKADRQDIAEVISFGLSESLNPETIVDGLIKSGWLDEREENLFLHDWGEWQDLWYKHQQRKKDDVERKRRALRDKQLEGTPDPLPKQEEVKPEERKPETVATQKPKKPKVSKVSYAEFVTMEESQYQKLVGSYGEGATSEMIRMLDNYKGSKGKTYKDDYRAILGWPLDKLKEKNPSIFLTENILRTQVESGGSFYGDWSGIM